MRRVAELLLALLPAVACGCGSSPAAVELIAVARDGLGNARAAQLQAHEDALGRVEARRQALDTAFDADVHLAAAGQLRDADGRPVSLDAEWVVSARKGYAAARDLLAEQARRAEAAHAARLDNLTASDEALEMATRLILERSALSARLREFIMQAQAGLLERSKHNE